MSEYEAVRWEQRYAAGEYAPRADHTPFLDRVVEVVPVGRALVLACGTGRNALRLAEAGFAVTGIDISPTAIERAGDTARRRGLDVELRVADLDDEAVTDGSYDLITMIRYANRPLMTRIPEALTPNGWVFVEHHLRTDREVVGPSCPDHRLGVGELLAAFGDLRVVHYEESFDDHDRPGSSACIGRLLACNGDPGF